MAKGVIFDVKRYAIHDGPGIRTTVFMKGCPLRCVWCANPESQRLFREFIYWPDRCLQCRACLDACKRRAITIDENVQVDESKCNFCGDCVNECYSEALQIIGQQVGREELLKEIEKDTDFYLESDGGVTFSGGEPFFQPEFLHEMLTACKGRNLNTAVDTCGYVSWDTISRVSPYVDLFLYDIKLMNEKKHREYTGVSNRLVLSNLEKLVGTHQVIVRIPLIPRMNDDADNISHLGDYLSKLDINRIDLLPYHRLGISKYERLGRRCVMEGIAPSTPELIDSARLALESYGLDVRIGG